MDLQIVKVIRTETSADFLLVTLADLPEQSDDPEHLYNHVSFEVFVRRADVMTMSLTELQEAAIAEAKLVMERINGDQQADPGEPNA